MNERPPWPVRRRLRLRQYDYSSAGAYFVTICTYERELLLGMMVDGHALLSPAGEIARRSWEDLPNHSAGLALSAFCVMPDHVHGIICILDANAGSLSEIVRGYKTFSARRVNEARGTPGAPVWQRGFYEHVIRNETDMEETVRYIAENPGRWAERYGG